MHLKFSSAAARLRRLAGLLPEREIFLRSGGRVRFIRVTRRAQLAAVTLAGGALVGCGALTVAMLAKSQAVARDRSAIEQQHKAVAAAASKVTGYKRSVDALARDLEERQDFMDELYRAHFGDEEGGNAAKALIGPADPAQGRDKPVTTGMGPEAAPLLRIEARQKRFAALLTGAVRRRADKAAAAIRGFGLNPDMLARSAARGQGGPFAPWKGDKGAMTDELEHLADALARMELLESSLVAIPSGRPTDAPMQSSSYGYRRDPFNGHAAFHAGIDFTGRYGQPILAAAKGKVSYVGQRQGYGNVVEVEHGNGLMTRYAHLSRFGARVGQPVARGEAIARMGSTGRSTGTHLHFEVRLNGQAINPRRFLEAREDILQIQQRAKARFADVGHRG